MKFLCCLESNSVNSCFEHATYQSQIVDSNLLPEVINQFFFAVTKDIPALSVTALNRLRMSLDPVPTEFVVNSADV